MRRLTALGSIIAVVAVYGTAARAATPAEVLCASYKGAIAKETNAAKREAMIKSLPRGCEVRAAPARKPEETKAAPKPKPEEAPAPTPPPQPAPPPMASPPQSPPPPLSTTLANGMTIAEANAAGNKAYQARKYADALKLFRMSAEAGDPTAEADIGDMYFHGHGVSVDYGQAMSWYHRAVSKGSASAAEGIGSLYARGQGVPLDYAEAAKWFRLAASKGNADAANWLGALYDHGWGVAKDPAEAQNWYAKARSMGPRR